jgi:hypothetical protein
MTTKRATNAEIAEREDFINQLMDLGISRSRLLGQIQKRFEVSRAQAYKDMARVASDRQSEGCEVIQPKGTEALREAIGLLHSASIDAYVDGDLKELPKLTKEMRELCKALGIGAALGGAQPNDVDGVGDTEIPDQIDPPLEVVAATRAAKSSS